MPREYDWFVFDDSCILFVQTHLILFFVPVLCYYLNSHRSPCSTNAAMYYHTRTGLSICNFFSIMHPIFHRLANFLNQQGCLSH